MIFDIGGSRRLMVAATALLLTGCAGEAPSGQGDASPAAADYPALTTHAQYLTAMEELSNWGRWGEDDELGAANFITPEKRAAAAALVTEGVTVSLAHDIVQGDGSEGGTVLMREVLRASSTGASDRYQYSGSYHGTVHSHLDAVGCHMMVDGQGYNGMRFEEIDEAGGCPKSGINVHKDGIVTRGIIFDATLLPGYGTPEGWVEPGTPIRAADLVALEEIQGVRVEPGDVILLHTGRWLREDALGAWSPMDGVAGYHPDVAYFLADRGVSFIGHDLWNDVTPHEFSDEELLPLHRLALVAMGVGIFDNLDLGRLAETARELGRYDFLFTAAPLRIELGMGSPLNPIATF